MKVRELASVIESFAPLSIQEEWDNSGLCIGSPEQDVHGVMLGFDCTPELIARATAACSPCRAARWCAAARRML